MGVFRGERRGGGVGRLIEGGGVGRLDGKNLQILDLHRLAPLRLRTVPTIVIPHTFCTSRDTPVSYW